VALPYSLLLILPFFYLVFKNRRKLHLLVISAGFICIFGGFSYIRNLIQANNPLFPLDFKLFGSTLFKGVLDSATYRVHFKPDDYKLSKLLFHEGLGAQTLLFIFPAVFLSLPVAFLRRRQSFNFNLAYFLSLPVLIYLVYIFIIPLPNARYLYSLLGVGVVSGLYLFNALNIPVKITRILVFICLLASIPELAKKKELFLALLLCCLLLASLTLIKKAILKIKKVRLVFVFISLIISLACLVFLDRDYISNEYSRYITMRKYSGFWPDATSAWLWLNQNTKRDNIAYAGRPVPFPLYGTNLKNNVYYVSVNAIEPAKLHFFTDSSYRWGYDFLSLHKSLEEKGNYRGNAEYPVWLNNLSKRNTSYLFVYSLHQTRDIEFPLEDSWAKKNPDIFELAFENNSVHIYKIKITKDCKLG
jgi:hypothetical protein